MAQERDIEIFARADTTLSFSATVNNAPFTSWGTTRFDVRPHDTSSTVIFVAPATINGDVATVTIAAADFLRPGVLRYSLKRVDLSVETVLFFGAFTVIATA
jgi:hypothetical protein